jgi:type II secretory pathway component PulL
MSHLQQEIAEIYRRHFPHATSLVAPKLRMEEKLRELQAAQYEDKLLQMVSYLGQGRAETLSVKIKKLDYQPGRLTVDLIAKTSEDVSRLINFLTKQGLQVNQQNASLVDEGMSASIVIEANH